MGVLCTVSFRLTCGDEWRCWQSSVNKCMSCRENELRSSSCLRLVLIWINDKANKFGCTQFVQESQANQLLSANTRQEYNCL